MSIKKEIQSAATATARTAKDSLSDSNKRGFGDVYLRTGDHLSPKETEPFLTIALAAAGSHRLVDYRTSAPIPPEHMSGLVLDIERRNKHTSLILVGPKDIVDHLSPAHISAAKTNSGFTVEASFPDSGTQIVHFWDDGTLWFISTDTAYGATRKVAIDPDGTLFKIFSRQLAMDQPAFSIVFIRSGTDRFRGQMEGLDVYLAPEFDSSS